MSNFDFMMYAILAVVILATVLIVLYQVFKMLREKARSKKPSKYQPTQYMQINAANRPTVTGASASGGYRTVKGFLVKLDVEKQNRHMPGRNAYEMARTNGNLRSVIFRDANALQKILESKAGTGEFIGANKEKVDFGQVIGQYVDCDGRSKRETKIGIIHYTAEGAYIVPARPDEGGVSQGE